jgi:MscS family membrane protein
MNTLANLLAQATTQPAESVWKNVWDSVHATIHHTTWRGWLVLLIGIFAGYVTGHIVRKVLETVSDRQFKRGWIIRSASFRSIASPASLLLLTIGVSIGLGGLALSGEVKWFVGRVLALAYIAGFGWMLFNLIDVVDLTLKRLATRTSSNLDDQMVPIVRKTLRLFLLIVLALFTLESVFERDVSTWLAGLGIVGLAVSFAAQDSIKNFFGSITILMDRPFQLNDQIIIDGHQGNVEDIGFRSTRMRRLDGILVTIPNSKIVEQSIQNVTRRPNLRRIVDISITYDTPADKIERAVQIVREILTEASFAEKFDTEKFPPRAHFNEMKADTLNLQVLYWYKDSTDWWGFQAFNQRFNLEVFKRFGAEEIELAFPTQTLYVKNADTQPPSTQTPPTPAP